VLCSRHSQDPRDRVSGADHTGLLLTRQPGAAPKTGTACHRGPIDNTRSARPRAWRVDFVILERNPRISVVWLQDL